MYDIRNPENAVRMTQSFLLEISYVDEDLPHVGIDGIYGERTRRAVRIFQRKRGLPETGRTDRETWNALYEAYLIAYAENERQRNRESRDRKTDSR